MPGLFVVNALLGALPVLTFLATLEHFDSFKLVRARMIFYVIGSGGAAAIGAYFANSFLLARLDIAFVAYSHVVGPVVEEALKALIVIALIRTNRIGFMFDAVILGFAVGAGFALVENLFYLQTLGLHHPAVWVVRGFGAAIMHGGATAVFAAAAHLTTAGGRGGVVFFLPGFIVAVALHSGFNYFLAFPVSSTVAMFVLLAGVMSLSLARDRKSIHDWIAVDFDHHRRLLAALDEKRHEDIGLGRLLSALHLRADDTVTGDIFAYVRTHTELVLKAEELLIDRERGEQPAVDDATREKLFRLQALEKKIGRTARMALRAHLHFNRHEFFELYMLEKEAGLAHPRAHGV